MFDDIYSTDDYEKAFEETNKYLSELLHPHFSIRNIPIIIKTMIVRIIAEPIAIYETCAWIRAARKEKKRMVEMEEAFVRSNETSRVVFESMKQAFDKQP